MLDLREARQSRVAATSQGVRSRGRQEDTSRAPLSSQSSQGVQLDERPGGIRVSSAWAHRPTPLRWRGAGPGGGHTAGADAEGTGTPGWCVPPVSLAYSPTNETVPKKKAGVSRV